MRNDDGTFFEVTAEPVIPGFDLDRVSCAAFLKDFTGDGWPDIVVINDSNSHANQMFIGQQTDGVFSRFEDVGTSMFPDGGIGGSANSALAEDLDLQDGFDLFIGNGRNNLQDRLWLDNGAGLEDRVLDNTDVDAEMKAISDGGARGHW